MALATEVRTNYHIAVSSRFVERVCATANNVTAEVIYQRALNENLRDITEGGTLPYGIASQMSSTLTIPLVLQVQSSRDATQPLRPCADASAEEAALGAALQKDTNTRLLRLVLSDGHTEIPAIELSTLHVFRTIPIPGEKLLIKEKAEVRNGAIIMTETCVLPLGGEVQQLKREFLARKNRADVPYQTSAGLEAAPRFQPLRLGNTAASSLSFKPVMCADRGRGGEGVGGGSRGRSGGGSRGRSGGRGYCGGRGSGGRHRLHHRGRGFGGDRVEPSQDFSSH